MVPGWEMEAYERLRIEIVKSVVKDLKKAMRKSDRLGFVCGEQKNLEKWFLSKWGQFLCGDKGEYIIEKCLKTYKHHAPGLCKNDVIGPLERFLEAQSQSYEQALKEIKAGHKLTHWMWWIFPQYKGIGVSEAANHYAIQSRDEAKAYWEHPILGLRLRECMSALLDLNSKDAVEIFGEVDAMKLKSCMTLFFYHGGQTLCGKVLDKFFPRELDWVTVGILLKE